MQDVAGTLFGDRRLRPPHQSLKCPRCDSLNTKFCYYNNYNLSQPRHFCKNCRRYWTNGGILRNVPVGGGCRKSKRSSKPAKLPKPSSPPPPPQELLIPSARTEEMLESRGSYGGVVAQDWLPNNQTAENGENCLIDSLTTVDHHQDYWSSQPTSTVEDFNQWSHIFSSHPLFLP